MKEPREPVFGPGLFPLIYWAAIAVMCWLAVDTFFAPWWTDVVTSVFGEITS